LSPSFLIFMVDVRCSPPISYAHFHVPQESIALPPHVPAIPKPLTPKPPQQTRSRFPPPSIISTTCPTRPPIHLRATMFPIVHINLQESDPGAPPRNEPKNPGSPPTKRTQEPRLAGDEKNP
jgi:hypothetical protein